jgi:hypothetical protein
MTLPPFLPDSLAPKKKTGKVKRLFYKKSSLEIKAAFLIFA